MSKKLGIGEVTLASHFGTLVEQSYIETFGSLMTFFVSKRLATLAMNVLSKKLSICDKVTGIQSPSSIFFDNSLTTLQKIGK